MFGPGPGSDAYTTSCTKALLRSDAIQIVQRDVGQVTGSQVQSAISKTTRVNKKDLLCTAAYSVL